MNRLNLLDIFCVPLAPVAVTYKIPQNTYPEHTHDVDEIVIVTSGEGIHTLNGKEYKVQRGDIFYVRTHDCHQFQNINELHLFNILCRCTEPPEKTVLPEFNYLKSSPKHWELCMSTLKNIEKSILPCLDAQCHILDDATPYMIRMLFTQILAHLWHGRLPQPSDGKRFDAKKIIVELIDYLNDRYADEHTLADLSQRHGLSERTLNRQFKEHTGLSPMHYLVELRLCKAIEILRHENIHITDLAFQCGFNDSNYFSDAFKKKFGIPPRSFRKKTNHDFL